MNHKYLPNMIWKSNVVFGMKIQKFVQAYKDKEELATNRLKL